MFNIYGFLKPAKTLLLLILITSVSAKPFESFVQKAIDDSTFSWQSFSSDNIKIFYQENSFAERHRMMLLHSATSSVDEVLTLLDDSPNGLPLNVFYLESRAEMERIVGHRYSGFSDWTGNGIFLVLNPDWRSFEKHEFAHIVTMGGWGSPHPSSQWMIEGIAIYCDGWCQRYSVNEIAFHFLSNGQLPKLEQLFNDFKSLGEIRAGISAASFISFIHQTYGIPKVRQIWLNGVEDLEGLLGGDPEQIENAWRLYLQRQIRENIEVDLDAIHTGGCG
ncbi:MAG: hypothetical protein JSW33_12060 [bacterium]|nr:MAG: hypothetical protein JSW33_12060 [bacterium]